MPQENEYQRHLTDHTQALANIEKYVEIADEVGISINARPTITIYNAYHLPETLEWLWERNIKINPTHLTYPKHLALTVLPKNNKQIIQHKYDNFVYKDNSIKELCDYIAKYMHSEDCSDLWNQFLKHTAFWDNSRSQNFSDACPYYVI